MKVLHFGCAYRPYRGGSRVRLENLVSAVDTNSIELALVTHTSSDSIEDDLPFSAVLRTKKANSLIPSLSVVRFIRAQKPSTVILHNSRVLLVWMMFYRFLFPEVHVVCELHSVRETNWVKQRINTTLYRRCSKVVVLSQGARDWIRLHHGILDAAVVSNGIPAASIQSNAMRKTRSYEPTSVHYAYAGSFHEWQGVRIVAKAARILGADFWRTHKLTFIGDGPAMPAVCSDLGPDLMSLDNIQVLGWRSAEETRETLQLVDFLLAPRPSTVATETVVPLKVTDSVLLNKPLIVSTVGGLTEFLNDPELGPAAVFVRAGDVSNLAETMGIGLDIEGYNAICGRLVRLQEKLPTWEQSAEHYATILSEIESEALV